MGDDTIARHPPGRGSHVSPAERLEIQRAYLTEAGATVSGLAKQLGRTRETITACLKGEDFDQLKAQVRAEAAESARDVLRRHVVRAAEKWAGPAIDVATQKGDHRAAKDLLLHTGVIEPLNAKPGSGVRVLSITTVNNQHYWRSSDSGRLYTAAELRSGAPEQREGPASVTVQVGLMLEGLRGGEQAPDTSVINISEEPADR